MTKYIAFLRGINVGNIRIKMADLKSAFEKMCCKDVTTFLQTGNVVFHSDKNIKSLKTLLEKGLSDIFNYEAYVLLYEYKTLASIISQYPMQREEGHHAYIVFVENDAAFKELKTAAKDIGEEVDWVKFGDGVIYWKVKKGHSLDTPFSKILSKKKYKSSTTVRNLNTLEKM